LSLGFGLRSFFRGGFFSIEGGTRCLVVCLGPFGLNSSCLFNHFARKNFGETID
jgi:hypothetical protein